MKCIPISDLKTMLNHIDLGSDIITSDTMKTIFEDYGDEYFQSLGDLYEPMVLSKENEQRKLLIASFKQEPEIKIVPTDPNI